MRLYYLTAEQWAAKIIKERRVKLSLFDELNDPFELLAYVLPTKDHRRVAALLQRHFTSTKGVICFSRNWENPVMWAHYGHKHYGMCLGFDVPDELVEQVSYEPDRLDLHIDLSKPSAGLDQNKVRRMLLTKFEAWRYENEYRVMADLNDRDADGHYYADFGNALMLREVIIGVRCHTLQEEIATWIGDIGHDVEIRKARLAFKKFKVVEQRMLPAILAGRAKSAL